MSIPVYTFGIPTTGQSLGVTKVPVQSNLDALALTQNVDHIPMNDASTFQGNHQFVRFPIAYTIPSALTANEWDIYTKISQGQTELWLRAPTSSNATTYPLTASNRNVANDALIGVSYLPGGMYCMWGFKAQTTSGQSTVSFQQAGFPLACYTVQATPAYNPSILPNGTATVTVGIINKNSFSYEFFTNSGSYIGFYWFAIGA